MELDCVGRGIDGGIRIWGQGEKMMKLPKQISQELSGESAGGESIPSDQSQETDGKRFKRPKIG